MSAARTSYLEAARQLADVVADERVAARWDDPGALDGMTVGAIACHLVGGLGSVGPFLDAEEPPGTRALTADRFFAGVSTDLDSDVHRGVRNGSQEQAAVGATELAAQARTLADDLARRLPLEPLERRITAMFGLEMRLDDFLVTRLVELTVHTDDLAVSAGMPTPPLSTVTAGYVVDCLIGVARRRHGDLEVIRALTRHERAKAAVLKVF